MKQLTDVIERFITDATAKLHTATIGKVVKVSAKTIDVQPVINLIYNGEDLPLPVLAEVPPVFMQGGGSYTAHPIAIGDYALVVFTERAYDRWYAGTDNVRPPELRMHDYSDGFAIVGINPLSKAIPIPSVITQIGDTYQDGNYIHDGDREQTGDYILNGNETVNGDVTVNGSTTVSNTVAASNFSGVGGSGMTSNVNIDAVSFSTGGIQGVSGSFLSADGKTITVTNGLVTGIS